MVDPRLKLKQLHWEHEGFELLAGIGGVEHQFLYASPFTSDIAIQKPCRIHRGLLDVDP